MHTRPCACAQYGTPCAHKCTHIYIHYLFMIRLIMCENIKMGGRGLHTGARGGHARAGTRATRRAPAARRRAAAAAAGAGAKSRILSIYATPHI